VGYFVDPEGSQNIEAGQAPILEPGHTLATVTDKISSIVLGKGTSKGWMFGFAISFALLMLLNVAVTYLLVKGVGIWGIRIPIGWGFAIVNFVWWIGIGHAGTLISAILLLLHQKWRTSINRFAEAMTIFAVACAGMFPLLHMGRPWMFYYLLPYPNAMWMWPQFRSPLVWDVFAVSTYATVSLLFWFVGMVPDLATLRDRAKNRAAQVVYGVLAMGWRGSAVHWSRYETASMLLAGLATPLVISVHTVVSFDFSVAIVPGWHSTIFPPYFVAGAIHSGLSMVLTLLVPMRRIFRIENIVTTRTLELIAESSIVTAFILFYSYVMEHFMAWYSADIFENQLYMFRLTGYYGWIMWLVVFCAVVAPMLYFFRKFRTDPVWLFIISVVINIGMWWERFVIVIQSMSQNFLPFQWGFYWPKWPELAYMFGTFCLFLLAFMLFAKYLPSIPISEVKKEAGIPTRKGDLFHEE
jgi:Ni/Fe-hydrogenase subunit HybB-like protein